MLTVLADIISRDFFAAQPDWILWLIILASIGALVFGADRLVSAAIRLSKAMGVSPVLIGATIVSLGTTSPEAAVSVKAAWAGDPGLALGNGMGSIICNTALIFGLCCCIKRLPLDRFVLNRHGLMQLGSGTLLACVILGLWLLAGRDLGGVVIGRGVGVVFVVLLIGYMWVSVLWARQHPEMAIKSVDAKIKIDGAVWRIVATGVVLLVGLGFVVGGAEFLIGSARQICLRYHVPEAVLAGTLVAFGTSLPELVTAITCIVKGHIGLSVGNIVGANVLNVLFVIGASAAARPLKVDTASFYLFVPAMMLVLVLFRFYVLINTDRFRRWQGVPLLVVYVAFVIIGIVLFRFGAG